MSDPTVEFPPHDMTEDFRAFSYDLAREMHRAGISHVRPENTEIYGKYFKNTDPIYARNRAACPLIKNGDVYRFIDDSLISHFVAQSLAAEADHQYFPGQ